jgi:hypothetical protein
MYPTVIIYRKKEKLLETSQWISKYGIPETVDVLQQLTINSNIKDESRY